MNCLYILEIKPLLVSSFANVFSHSVGCLFGLFMVSFAEQNLVSLIRSHLFIFVFISIALGDWPKKTLVRFMLKECHEELYAHKFDNLDKIETFLKRHKLLRSLQKKTIWIATCLFFFNLFLAALGLHCGARAFSSCGEWGLLFVAVCRLLIVVSSLVAEHGLWACGLQ